jgi:two-component system response regulator TctD
MKLLLVEDNPAMQTSLQRALGRRGMQVHLCSDGLQALAQWQQVQPDAVLLDLTLPGCDGLEVLAQGRQKGLRTPVIILTARGTVGDRILGLNTSADDYLAKPFDLDELEARLHALVRRTTPSASDTAALAAPPKPSFCGISEDPHSGALYHLGQVLELPPREAALLRALLVRPGHAMSKERLFECVFPNATEIQYEAIEVVVYRLRKKIAHTGAQLVTLRGLGYLIRAAA